jgi:pimeloyl-ACP methyl ester carboxylesterase
MATKPVVFFVHGSWHNPNHFRPIRDIFEQEGYKTECPAQPTIGAPREKSENGFAEDVQTIKDALTALVDDGNEVVVIMHSYGGVIGSNAVHKDLSKEARSANGLEGGVVYLVYLCAFVLPAGHSLASALGGSLPPYIKFGVCSF